jgi:hypothetical protein
MKSQLSDYTANDIRAIAHKILINDLLAEGAAWAFCDKPRIIEVSKSTRQSFKTDYLYKDFWHLVEDLHDFLINGKFEWLKIQYVSSQGYTVSTTVEKSQLIKALGFVENKETTKKYTLEDIKNCLACYCRYITPGQTYKAWEAGISVNVDAIKETNKEWYFTAFLYETYDDFCKNLLSRFNDRQEIEEIRFSCVVFLSNYKNYIQSGFISRNRINATIETLAQDRERTMKAPQEHTEVKEIYTLEDVTTYARSSLPNQHHSQTWEIGLGVKITSIEYSDGRIQPIYGLKNCKDFEKLCICLHDFFCYKKAEKVNVSYVRYKNLEEGNIIDVDVYCKKEMDRYLKIRKENLVIIDHEEKENLVARVEKLEEQLKTLENKRKK